MEIKCPHCNQVFNLDEDLASHIRDQIRNQEFENEVKRRVASVESTAAAQKNNEVALAVAKEREASLRTVNEYNQKLSMAQMESEKIKAEMINEKSRHEIEVQQAVLQTEKEYAARIGELETQLKAKAMEAEYYKDLKAKMSTKMVGETLEQHCEMEFNKVRMMAFPRAEFGKDNEVSKESGSKGDYIFRDFDENGTEIISIMFEMKNEMETTDPKARKKNEYFFKELDKDRKEKNCEYAVLVSMLEPDNELYNTGIVDMSHRYEKMYVIRPQFFIQLITILRNAALNTVGFRRQLTALKTQNVDLTNFEDNLTSFKEDLEYNHGLASRKLEEAIKQIDKAINDLNKTREALISSSNNFARANKKVQDITVKRLTRNAPTVAEKIREARENKGEAANADD